MLAFCTWGLHAAECEGKRSDVTSVSRTTDEVMLDLKCDRCGAELNQPGALLFSPPRGDGWLVEKYHLCVECYKRIAAELRTCDANRQKPPRS